MEREYISLFDLREAVKPILEREEAQNKKNIASFLKALAPEGYPKAETTK